MMCITLINGLVLINAYIGVNHRLQNFLMIRMKKVIRKTISIKKRVIKLRKMIRIRRIKKKMKETIRTKKKVIGLLKKFRENTA